MYQERFLNFYVPIFFFILARQVIDIGAQDNGSTCHPTSGIVIRTSLNNEKIIMLIHRPIGDVTVVWPNQRTVVSSNGIRTISFSGHSSSSVSSSSVSSGNVGTITEIIIDMETTQTSPDTVIDIPPLLKLPISPLLRIPTLQRPDIPIFRGFSLPNFEDISSESSDESSSSTVCSDSVSIMQNSFKALL